MNIHDSKERERFWEACRGCAEENRVAPERSPHYPPTLKTMDPDSRGMRK